MAPGQKSIPSTPAAYSGSISGNGGYGNVSTTPNGGYPNPTLAGNQVNSQTQGQASTPYPTAPGSNSNYNTGFGNPGNQTSPTQMINNLLTSPRPGGMPAGAGAPGMGGMVIGGVAGVASTRKGHGVKRYNEQDEYQKWEFYYDATSDMRGVNTLPNNGQPVNNNGNQPTTGATPNGPFGGPPGGGTFGGSPPGGSTGGAFGGSTNSGFGSGNIGSGNLGSGSTVTPNR
jgi:hypothetical protein